MMEKHGVLGLHVSIEIGYTFSVSMAFLGMRVSRMVRRSSGTWSARCQSFKRQINDLRLYGLDLIGRDLRFTHRECVDEAPYLLPNGETWYER